LKEWQRIGGMLKDSGILRQTDLVVFEDYCRTLTDLRTYECTANAAGAEERIEKGFLGAVVKLRAQLNQLRRELGLSPSSRSALRLATKPENAGDEKVNRYLRALPGGQTNS
jgi:P27 family predicted phage terminase small subunit